VPSIREFMHWRVIPNEYPYDRLFKTSHMLIIKRAGVRERFDLTINEKLEFDKIMREYVYPHYSLWLENCPARRTKPGIYHVHLLTYKDLEPRPSILSGQPWYKRYWRAFRLGVYQMHAPQMTEQYYQRKVVQDRNRAERKRSR